MLLRTFRFFISLPASLFLNGGAWERRSVRLCGDARAALDDLFVRMRWLLLVRRWNIEWLLHRALHDLIDQICNIVYDCIYRGAKFVYCISVVYYFPDMARTIRRTSSRAPLGCNIIEVTPFWWWQTDSCSSTARGDVDWQSTFFASSVFFGQRRFSLQAYRMA